MGNCLILQEKSVSVMKTDGKILEFKAPIKVHQVLSEYTHHALSDKLPVVSHLHPNTDMLQGRLYYLLPLPVAPRRTKKTTKKKVRFSDDLVKLEEEKDRQTSGVVRIKVVISRQELQAMLAKEGVSVEDMISRMQKAPKKVVSVDEEGGSLSWLPALESIPELS